MEELNKKEMEKYTMVKPIVYLFCVSLGKKRKTMEAREDELRIVHTICPNIDKANSDEMYDIACEEAKKYDLEPLILQAVAYTVFRDIYELKLSVALYRDYECEHKLATNKEKQPSKTPSIILKAKRKKTCGL